VKVEFLGPTPGGHSEEVRYVLRAETPVELRFLTILRDVGENSYTHIRVAGHEKLGRQSQGLPQDPVAALALQVVKKPASPTMKVDNVLDPNLASRPLMVAPPGRGRLQSSSQVRHTGVTAGVKSIMSPTVVTNEGRAAQAGFVIQKGKRKGE